ncbi:hypothetical protein L227DRAFT_551690 [Lentinus tigrinus ALCF2SS1-6]|uniref:Cyclin N-terminal domain-containing protein n=2 Tax=Lentinus tigrinus TaxID=5365 RepID=A0A5C2S2V0_9APHY|nr:hypothetical protein L227DRAFT_551690 [Lentinus tigrinus ALCF2SS1-6]
MHLFACPDVPPPSPTATSPTPSPPLANFIAYVIHRTKRDVSVTFAALYLLHRLKARHPAARGSSGHRLFLSGFIVASKVLCDDCYSSKAWVIVGQGMFALRDINQMEREFCKYMDWDLNVGSGALKEFEERVRQDFKGFGPYPIYTPPAPDCMPSSNLGDPALAAASALTARSHQPPSISSQARIPPPVPIHAGPPMLRTSNWTSLPMSTSASSALNAMRATQYVRRW